MEKELEFDRACRSLPPELGRVLSRVATGMKQNAMEIRLRAGAPISVFDGQSNWFIGESGKAVAPAEAMPISAELLRETLIRLCGYSVQSYAAELERGYITTPEGNRVGVCLEQGAGLAVLRPLSLNIRLAREMIGAADALLPTWRSGRGMILAGPPASGKTTILRDFARQISQGTAEVPPQKVAVVDERYEISGLCRGLPSFHLGACTDVLPGYGKREGIGRAVRTLSPQVILCDEIASPEEIEEIRYAFACGVRFLVSVHCGSREDLTQNTMIHMLIQTGAFSHIILLQVPHAGNAIKEVIACDTYPL